MDVDKWLQQAVGKDADRKHSSSSQHQQSPGPDLLDLNTSESGCHCGQEGTVVHQVTIVLAMERTV